MDSKEPIDEALLQLQRELSVLELDDLKRSLAFYVNDLLLNDFPRLVQLLYRIDVSEKKVKEVLRAAPDQDAGLLIADLIVQRQLEKWKARGEAKGGPDSR
jgi:hypothetical protein